MNTADSSVYSAFLPEYCLQENCLHCWSLCARDRIIPTSSGAESMLEDPHASNAITKIQNNDGRIFKPITLRFNLVQETSNLEAIKQDLKLFVADLYELDKSCRADSWSENMFAGELGLSYSTITATFVHKKLVAFLVQHTIGDASHILNIGVSSKYRRMKLATNLVLLSLDVLNASDIKKVILEVRESNKPAQSLYLKSGFSVVATRPQYYKNPLEDALVMSLEA